MPIRLSPLGLIGKSTLYQRVNSGIRRFQVRIDVHEQLP